MFKYLVRSSFTRVMQARRKSNVSVLSHEPINFHWSQFWKEKKKLHLVIVTQGLEMVCNMLETLVIRALHKQFIPWKESHWSSHISTCWLEFRLLCVQISRPSIPSGLWSCLWKNNHFNVVAASCYSTLRVVQNTWTWKALSAPSVRFVRQTAVNKVPFESLRATRQSRLTFSLPRALKTLQRRGEIWR